MVKDKVEKLKDELTLNQAAISIALPCLVIMLGAALRFYDLGAESYWLDEMTTLRIAQGSVESIFLDTQECGRPPVHILLVHFWMQVCGTSEVATRFPSAFAGIASIAVMYAVGQRLFGRKVGVISAFLMAISWFQIYNSQECRYYSLFVLMALLSFFFYNRAIESRRVSRFVPYVLASILLFYTHLYGVFVLVAQNLHFFIQWHRYRTVRGAWVLSQTLVLLAIGPGILIPLEGTLAGTYGPMTWIPDPDVWLLVLTVLGYVGANYPSWATLIAGMAFLVSATLGFVVYVGKERWLASVRHLPGTVRDLSSRANEPLLVICWLLCPIVLPWVLSKVLAPMYTVRYTISASPAFYLLLSLGMARLNKVIPEPILLGLLVILIAPGLQEYYVNDVKEQWREAAAYVEENAREDDIVMVFSPAWGRDTFDWYYEGPLRECEIDEQRQGYAAITDALPGCIPGSGRFWLILRERRVFDEDFTELLSSRDYERMRLITEKKFTLVFVHLFAVDRAVEVDRSEAYDVE